MAMAAAVAALAGRAGREHGSRVRVGGHQLPRLPGRPGPLAGPTARPTAPTGAVVAIDGPAGVGQVDRLAQAVAERLGLERLDTGAMYRAVAWAALDRGVDPADAEAVAAMARGAGIEVGGDRVTVDGTT